MIFTASFQTTDCSPSLGFQWNLTKVDSPAAFTNRNVWTPKPSMKRNERGMARSDIVHMTMWVASGIREMKSQKLSCADCAWGNPRSGACFTECTRSGNLIGVLDEEHRDVVADEIPVPLLRVELDGEPPDVTGQVGGALVAGHRREPDEDRRPLSRPLEQVGPGDVGERLVRLEEAVRAEASGVDHPFGDALVVEMEDLLPEVEVLQQRRAAVTRPQRVLVVGDGHALLRRQPGRPPRCGLVGLTAGADLVDELAGRLSVGRRDDGRSGRPGSGPGPR